MRTADTTHSRYIRRTDVPDPNPNHTSGKCTTTNGVSNTSTHYFDIGGCDDEITSVQFRWLDSTTSGTFTVESTNLPVTEALYDDAAGSKWYPESTLVITSPSASAAGTFMLHIGNSGTKRLRVKYVALANSEIEIVPFGVD
jgi:hypothetical protein